MNHQTSIMHKGVMPAILFSIILSLLGAPQPVYAAGIDVQPLTWNIIGLDSNKPAAGPNHFPVGARVCNNTGALISNVKADFIWDNTINSTYIYERPGTDTSITMFAPPEPALADGACADFYFEVEVLKVSDAYNKTRRYHIEVTSTETGAAVYGTPTPRELFVEYLVSQSRNAVTDVQYGTNLASLTSVPNGGTMSLVVGQTYYIKLVGFTATQGYNQLESFINFPNTIFQILSVNSVYSAPSAGYTIDKMYSDACGWDNVISSPTYRSCIVSDDKTGGNITVTYQVKILSVPGGVFTNPEPLSTLIYDFSGSSYHYNADFGISTRYAYVLDPASAVNISKKFTPSTTNVNGVSSLTFTLSNNAPVALSNLNFTDTTPGMPNTITVANPANISTSSCGSSISVTAIPGTSSISVADATVPANGSCTISVNVTPSTTAGSPFINTTDNLFVGTTDTGKTASAQLTVSSAPPPGVGLCNKPLAQWVFTTGYTLASPEPYAPNTTVSASASGGAGVLLNSSTDNHTTNPPTGTGSWGSNGNIDASGATLVTTQNDYFEFAINTTGLSSVDLNLYAERKTANGPLGIAVYVGASNTRPETGTSVYNNPTALSASASIFYPIAVTNITAAQGLNSSGTTYFRVYAFNAGNSNTGSDIYIDDVTFTGCGAAQNARLEKSFSPAAIAPGGVSTLTFILKNPNTAPLTLATFTDNLPTGMMVADPPSASTTCTGGPTWVPAAGDTTLTFGNPPTNTNGGTIPAATGTPLVDGSCIVRVNVTATAVGTYDNVSGFIYTKESGTNTGSSGVAKASLVVLAPPVITKQFAPNPILVGGISTLTFIITNPNQSDTLPGVSFTDNLPLVSGNQMRVASTPNASYNGSCGAPSFAPAVNSTSILFGAPTGATIAGGSSCTIKVDVTAPAVGSYPNIVNAQASVPDQSGAGSTTITSTPDSDTLTVTDPNPAISILKRVSTDANGPGRLS